jgi:A/G-specific adenine glycosylase
MHDAATRLNPAPGAATAPKFPPDAAQALLRWYDRHGRRLPWRARPGEARNPYHVWLSEVMLQQTTVATVLKRWPDFLQAFPTVEALAAAPWDQVATAWAGLGYYARARRLQQAAQRIAASGFPATRDGWRALPGIGPYTAAAIAAIAHDHDHVALDGNVERVFARIFRIPSTLAAARATYEAAGESLAACAKKPGRAGDLAQALFDLGAEVCRPRNPSCVLCPWQGFCAARRHGEQEKFPRKAAKPAKQARFLEIFWIEDAHGFVLASRRTGATLLDGMLQLPNSGLTPQDPPFAPDGHEKARPVGTFRHAFTHIDFTVTVRAVEAPGSLTAGEGEVLVHRSDMARAGLPSLMAKAARLALARRP